LATRAKVINPYRRVDEDQTCASCRLRLAGFNAG
jgi:hypothetical protein